MTATHVNGVEVIAVEPIPSGFSKIHGKLVPLKQTVRLLLADGSETFGCVHSDHTDTKSPQALYKHLREHNGPPKPRTRRKPQDEGDVFAPAKTAVMDMTVGELVQRGQQVNDLLNTVARLIEDRDQWKKQARAAEKFKADLQKVLGGPS